MAASYTNGYTDTITNITVAGSNTTWADLGSSPYATWANWKIWNPSPKQLTATETIDMGTVALRQPSANWISANYAQSVVIKISDTGAFAGEETTVTMAGTTTQSYVQGRYYKITAIWATDSLGTVPWVGEFTFNAIINTFKEILKDVSTSTLSGTAASRTVAIQGMAAYDVKITVKKNVTWVDRAYALPDDYSITTIPPVASYVTKNPLTICLVDHFGVPVDGTVDLEIEEFKPIFQDPLYGSVIA